MTNVHIFLPLVYFPPSTPVSHYVDVYSVAFRLGHYVTKLRDLNNHCHGIKFFDAFYISCEHHYKHMVMRVTYLRMVKK